ncbi:hypothetical protein Y032_0041g383 [Ancylostoma ceylanicum]|uniref:Peptidase M12A domain-containing protein n=1 Tax=Ancylostoma ceylanicum TaxID=53326 RepID=A0A016UG90_9BILA|nr:hypothetical protein Y032_0041g383 [Ancylostoma ceylanicum]
MRAFLLVLFCVGSGFSSVFQEKVKNALAKVNITLDIEQLRKTHDRIEGVRPKIEEMLKLSPQEKISLADLVEHTIKVRKNHVRPKGDSIEEINHKSKLGGLLYQGDIVLTKTQAEDIVEDTKANTNNRPKRQAFLDRRLPQTRWDKGVDYYFHSNATEDVKRVFLKAMNIWMKDTCIDFRENDKAEDRLCVTRSAGLCFSSVGRVGGLQNLSLDDGCESVRALAVLCFDICATRKQHYHASSLAFAVIICNIVQEHRRPSEPNA